MKHEVESSLQTQHLTTIMSNSSHYSFSTLDQFQKLNGGNPLCLLLFPAAFCIIKEISGFLY